MKKSFIDVNLHGQYVNILVSVHSSILTKLGSLHSAGWFSQTSVSQYAPV